MSSPSKSPAILDAVSQAQQAAALANVAPPVVTHAAGQVPSEVPFYRRTGFAVAVGLVAITAAGVLAWRSFVSEES